MKLLGSTKSKITKDKFGEKVSHLEIGKVVLVHLIILNNDYQQDLWVLHTFIPVENFIFLKIFDSEIKDKINITLVINWSRKYHDVIFSLT